jgi:hypothetical protein
MIIRDYYTAAQVAQQRRELDAMLAEGQRLHMRTAQREAMRTAGPAPVVSAAAGTKLERMTPQQAAALAGVDPGENTTPPIAAAARPTRGPLTAQEVHELQGGTFVESKPAPETAADRRRAFLAAGVTEAEFAAFEEQDRLEAEITEAKRLHRPTF